ncbi:thymidylate kinase [Jatrophihabitans endophyticus]|uniref:Thymidylate kinase n=1 Tax=Jatrophihabitans endophyticus TaxID=1206085 RepID=A0A1M5H0K9_9ACTN|nr:MFS transporter [Jatrophihabitans endophyticus]SHG09494.1 thymidylate kinase [Jatrophihabitans endophyticus]
MSSGPGPPGSARRPRRENALLTLARIPVVRRMWAAITLSSLGDWLGLLANTALAQQLTREQSYTTQGAAISGVILVRLAPDLLFGPIAAALADKLDRRKTVIVGDLAAGVLYASIAFGYNLIWLYIAQFAIEAIGLFTQPCKQVIQVSIVPKRLLPTANQISLFSVYGTVPVAAGLFALLSATNRLVSSNGTVGADDVNVAIVIALLVNTVTFAVSASTVFVSRRDIPAVPADREQEQSIVSLLREGISYIRRNALIRGLYVGIIGAFAAGGLTVGVAQLWVRTLGGGAAGYSIMFGTVFAGLAVGMLVGPRVLPSYARSRVFGFAIGAAGLSLLTMSLIRDFILATVFAAFVGLFAGMAWIIGYTMIGQEVEDRLRGRIFSFVLSSVRLVLLLTIAVGPVLAGLLGEHRFKVGESYLRFSGPGLTLLVGGLLALLVSFYATSRAGQSRKRFRDLVRQRVLNTAGGRYGDQRGGLLVAVDGTDRAVTARYAALLSQAARDFSLTVVETAEPTGTPAGRHVAELLAATDHAGLEPETAALLSAADRAEHVAVVIRPALDRGEVVVCDGYLLSSLAVHGGGRGADAERIRDVHEWSTGDLRADLTVVVDTIGAERPGADDIDLAGVSQAYDDEIDAHPGTTVRCQDPAPVALPVEVAERLERLVSRRASLLTSPVGELPEVADLHSGPA